MFTQTVGMTVSDWSVSDVVKIRQNLAFLIFHKGQRTCTNAPWLPGGGGGGGGTGGRGTGGIDWCITYDEMRQRVIIINFWSLASFGNPWKDTFEFGIGKTVEHTAVVNHFCVFWSWHGSTLYIHYCFAVIVEPFQTTWLRYDVRS